MHIKPATAMNTKMHHNYTNVIFSETKCKEGKHPLSVKNIHHAMIIGNLLQFLVDFRDVQYIP